MCKEPTLTVLGSSAVAAHRSYEQRLAAQAAYLVDGGAEDHSDVADTATSRRNRDSHSRSDAGGQVEASKSRADSARNIIDSRTRELLVHPNHAGESSGEGDASGNALDADDHTATPAHARKIARSAPRWYHLG